MSDYTPTNRQSLDRMIRDYGRERVDVRPSTGKLGGHDVFVDGQWTAWMWAIGPTRETNDPPWMPSNGAAHEDTTFSALNEELLHRGILKQWHEQRHPGEPECPKGKWRTRERDLVVDLRQIDDRYLLDIERFSRKRPQHRDKRREVLAEVRRRNLTKRK